MPPRVTEILMDNSSLNHWPVSARVITESLYFVCIFYVQVQRELLGK